MNRKETGRDRHLISRNDVNALWRKAKPINLAFRQITIISSLEIDISRIGNDLEMKLKLNRMATDTCAELDPMIKLQQPVN